MNIFTLKVITPVGLFYSGAIEYMSADTPDGKVGFLRGASPRVSILSRGKISVRTAVLSQNMICGDGMIIVGSDGVTVITEKCRLEGDEDIAERSFGELNDESAREYKTGKATRARAAKNLSGGDGDK